MVGVGRGGGGWGSVVVVVGGGRGRGRYVGLFVILAPSGPISKVKVVFSFSFLDFSF